MKKAAVPVGAAAFRAAFCVRLDFFFGATILAVGDEILDDRRVGQRRDVAECAELVLSDLAQDAAHDLAGAGLRQAGRELDQIRRRNRADLAADPVLQLLLEVLARRDALHQRDIGIDALSLDVVRIADDRSLGDAVVRDQRALDLGRAHAMAGHVDHVIDAAGDPVIAVGIAPAAVAGEVHALIGGEIGLLEALMVAI